MRIQLLHSNKSQNIISENQFVMLLTFLSQSLACFSTNMLFLPKKTVYYNAGCTCGETI